MNIDQEYQVTIQHALNLIQALMNKLMFEMESRKEEIDAEFTAQFNAMEIQLQRHIETERLARNTLADLTAIARDSTETFNQIL